MFFIHYSSWLEEKIVIDTKDKLETDSLVENGAFYVCNLFTCKLKFKFVYLTEKCLKTKSWVLL